MATSSRYSFVTYGVTTISADKTRLTGFFFASLWNDLMEKTKMNLTYVEDKVTGSCTDTGNHTGILDSLYNNFSDWALIPFSELNCSRSEDFTYGSVFSDLKNTLIHSHPRIDHEIEDKEHSSHSDIIIDIPYTSTARLINASFYLIFFALIATCSLMAAWHVYQVRRIKLKNKFSNNRIKRRLRPPSTSRKLMATASHIIQVFTRQGLTLRTNRISVRILWFLFMIHTFMGSTIYFSVFKTNLLKPRHVVRLNNLNDLVRNPVYKARFPIETNTWKLFADAKSDPMKTIWERSKKIDEFDEQFAFYPRTGSLLYYDKEKKNPFTFLDRANRFNWAIISHYANNRFVMEAYCYSYENFKFQFYHSRESFLHASVGIVFRKNLNWQTKNKVARAIGLVNQFGFHDYYDKNPQGVWRKTETQRKCHNMLLATANLSPEEKVADLSLVHLIGLLQIDLFVLVMAFITLFHEKFIIPKLTTWRKVKKVKHLPNNSGWRVNKTKPSGAP